MVVRAKTASVLYKVNSQDVTTSVVDGVAVQTFDKIIQAGGKKNYYKIVYNCEAIDGAANDIRKIGKTFADSDLVNLYHKGVLAKVHNFNVNDSVPGDTDQNKIILSYDLIIEEINSSTVLTLNLDSFISVH